MASKVNTKFVVLLSAGVLVAFAGVAYTAYSMLQSSPEELVARGNERLAAGDIRGASLEFSKAVNNDQTNVELLTLWRDSVARLAADNAARYQEDFGTLRSAIRQLALVQEDNLAARREYLELLNRQVEGSTERAAQEQLIAETDLMLAQHRAKSPSEWDTLRRFRGAAILRQAANFPDVPEQRINEARADLEAAIAADPTDGEATAWLEGWLSLQATRARTDRRDADAARFDADADAVVAAALARTPDDPIVSLVRLRRDIEAAARGLQGRPRAELVAASNAFQRENAGRLDRIADLVAGMGRAALDTGAFGRFRQIEELLDPPARSRRSEAVLRSIIARNPADGDLRLLLGDVLATRGSFAEAMAAVAEVEGLAIRPTSLEGLRQFGQRTTAVYLQALWAVRAWSEMRTEEAGAEKTAMMARARELRDRLASQVAPDSPLLTLVDAQLAFVEGDMGRADQLLARYNRATERRDADALFLSAQVAIFRNNFGAAKAALEDVLRMRPSNVGALAGLAQIETRLENLDRAAELWSTLVDLSPETVEFRQQLSMVNAARGQGVPESADPALRTLAELEQLTQRLAGAPDQAAQAVAFLRPRVEQSGWDHRLAFGLAQWQMRAGQRDEALRTIRTGMERRPDSALLRQLELTLTAATPLEARLARIEMASVSDLEKALLRHQAFQEAGDEAKARAELARAAELGADDPRVVEFQFMQALAEPNWELAQSLEQRAITRNLDQSGGDTFRARRLAAQGRAGEAISIMEALVAKGGAQPEAWRLLGRMRAVSGRQAEAAAAFREALAIRPNDVAGIVDLIRTLVATGQNAEALRVAREYERYGRDDADFLDLRLRLEAEEGDRALALRRREELARLMPSDRRNRMALAAMYVDGGDSARAADLIAAVRQEGDTPDALLLDARARWTLGREDEAKRIVEEWLTANGEPLGVMFAYAEFLVNRQRPDAGIAVLERARARQDPSRAEADRALVAVMFQLQRYAEVPAVARRVIDAGADADGTVRKQMIEALMLARQLDEAERELDALASGGGEPDVRTLILRSDLQGFRNQRAEQVATLDNAVRRFPREPMVFLKRGQALLATPDRIDDAIADLDRALILKPDMWQALRVRALALAQKNDMDRAVADLQQALRIQPNNNELLFGLTSDLLRMNREAAAVQTASEVFRRRPRDADAMIGVGEIFRSMGSLRNAQRFYRMAYDVDRRSPAAQRLLDSLLDDTPPNTTDAEAVLTQLGARVRQEPGFLMALGRLRHLQNRPGEGNEAILATFNMLDARQTNQMLAWMNDLQKITPEVRTLDQFLAAASTRVREADWMAFFRANLALATPDVRDKGPWQQVLRTIAEKDAAPAGLRKLSLEALANSLYAQARYEEAAAVMKATNQAFPDDPETLNNLAFVLAKHLNRASEAVPLAEQAVRLRPQKAEFLDTLGVAYQMTGQHEKAAGVLERAMVTAGSLEVAAAAGSHLITSLVALNRADLARRVVEAIEGAMRDQAGQTLSADRRAEFERAKALIPAP